MPDDKSLADSADAEALDWLLALQETPDDAAVIADFEQWLDASRINRAAWQETAGVYVGIGETSPVHGDVWQEFAARGDTSLAPPIAALRRIRPSSHRSSARSQRRTMPLRKITAAALPAAAAAMLAVVAMPEIAVRWQADELAGTGELREIVLADGSRAALAPGSAIDIDYSGAERRIALLRGKAWFDVNPDSRPFRVTAGDMETTDIGTAFEVALSQGGLQVAVESGIVRVDDTRSGRVVAGKLTAGDVLSVDQAGRGTRDRVSPALVAAWRDGQIAVEGRPMREVIDALRPWHKGIIIIRSRELAERRVTGVYDLRHPARAMEALTKAHGGRVQQLTPWVMILADE